MAMFRIAECRRAIGVFHRLGQATRSVGQGIADQPQEQGPSASDDRAALRP